MGARARLAFQTLLRLKLLDQVLELFDERLDLRNRTVSSK